MSHLTRYPNQFYQSTPERITTPAAEPSPEPEPEEIAQAELAIPPSAPPLTPRRKAMTTSVSAHDLAVPGLDHWSQVHGTH